MGAWLSPRWNEAIGLRVYDVNPLRKELTFGRIVVNQNGTQTFAEAQSRPTRAVATMHDRPTTIANGGAPRWKHAGSGTPRRG